MGLSSKRICRESRALEISRNPRLTCRHHRLQIVRQVAHTARTWPLLDPPGEVDLEDRDAVVQVLKEILDRKYAGQYDAALLHQAMDDVTHAFHGSYPGLLACDTLYHDLRHCLETGLTMARMIDGYAERGKQDQQPDIDADHALLGIVLALFHDIGLLRRDTETRLWGPTLTPIHEQRGVEFMNAYLKSTTLARLADKSRLIMATKLAFSLPDEWTREERVLASMVATADLVSQISDRYYLEKCRDFLFLEFSAFGMAGKPDSPYPDSLTLLKKTPGFVREFVRARLDKEFTGVFRYLRIHMKGADPWEIAMERHIRYLETCLASRSSGVLRRLPKPFR